MIIKPFTITAEFFNNLFYSIRTAIKLKWSSEDLISFISAFLLISSFALTIYFKEMKQKRIPVLEYEYINAVSDISNKRIKNNNPLSIVNNQLPFGNTLSKDEIIYLQSNAMKKGINNVFSLIEEGSLVYLSSIENAVSYTHLTLPTKA